MKKLMKVLAVTGMVGAAALTASDAEAWWGWGPWGGGPWDGTGFGDFNMSFRGSGSGYGYGNPYYYGGPWGGYPGYYGGPWGGYPGYYGGPWGGPGYGGYPYHGAPRAPQNQSDSSN